MDWSTNQKTVFERGSKAVFCLSTDVNGEMELCLSVKVKKTTYFTIRVN